MIVLFSHDTYATELEIENYVLGWTDQWSLFRFFLLFHLTFVRLQVLNQTLLTYTGKHLCLDEVIYTVIELCFDENPICKINWSRKDIIAVFVTKLICDHLKLLIFPSIRLYKRQNV